MIFERAGELLRERWRASRPWGSPEAHLDAAISWLFAAQDATPDRGVSHSYLVGERWMRSYPETTGYIIPTLLNWSRCTGNQEAERRALEMADWEIGIQLDAGPIPDIRDGAPVVFDTGQVIFGWVAAYRHAGTDRYLEAAQRAADWLLTALDAEGVWRSPHDAGGPGRVYNARVAWALLELARLSQDARFEAPVRRFLDWTLEQERGSGWYDYNCLTDDSAPLLHTIAYTARGQLESGLLLGEERYVEAARRTAKQLIGAVGSAGRLPGRFDRNWQPRAGWACLTGMAQTSILWRRLSTTLAAGDATGTKQIEELVETSRRVNSFLMRTQDRTSRNPGLRGGIRGSYPVNGAYGRWRVLNWATKFFIDALMADLPGDVIVYPG